MTELHDPSNQSDPSDHRPASARPGAAGGTATAVLSERPPRPGSPDDDAVVIELRPRVTPERTERPERRDPTPRTEQREYSPAEMAARLGRPNVPVDPRMAARRADVRSERRRRRMRRAAWAGMPLLLLCGLFALTRSSLLDVDRIDVRGAENTSRQAVLAAASVDRGHPMTDVDLRGARNQIAELPWVAEVSVQRRWPGRIQVDLVEREAVASLKADDGSWYLVDAEGFATARAVRPAPGLTSVPGFDRPITVGEVIDRDGQALVTVASSLPRIIKRDTDQVSVSTEVGVELVMGSIRVLVGSDDDLDLKMIALSAVLDQVDMADVCAVDVRVPDFPAVKRDSCP